MADEAFLRALESLHADAEGLVRAIREEQREMSRARDHADEGRDTTGQIARGLDRQGEALGAAAISGRDLRAAAALALARGPEFDAGLRFYAEVGVAAPLPPVPLPELAAPQEAPASEPAPVAFATAAFAGLWERLEAEMATLDEALAHGLRAAEALAADLETVLGPSSVTAPESRPAPRVRSPLQP